MAARAAEPAQPEVARAAAEQEQGARLGTLNDVLAGAPSLSASPEYASASEDMQHCASSASPLASRDSTRINGAEDGRQSRRTSSGSSEYGAASSRQQRKKGMEVSDQHSHAFVDKLPISSSAVYMNQTRLEPPSKSDTSEREEARLSSQTSLQVQEETLVSRTSPTSSRRSSFIKTGSSMPTSSSAQKQLWESGGISASSSNNATLVAASASIPSYIRSHFRSGSGGTIVGMSGTSSSSSEAIEPMNGEHIRYSGSSMPVTDRERLQAMAEGGMPRKSLPVAPSTCSSARDRPRNGGSALRYQRGSLTSKYLDHANHPISPAQISPLMPLIFQPDLPLEMLNYTNKSARVLHTIYPLLYHLHIPLTLFLDFNAVYALVQIASQPTPQDSATTGTGIQSEPRVNPWWIAVGFYALSTLTWLVVVVILHDIWYSYQKVWKNRKCIED